MTKRLAWLGVEVALVWLVLMLLLVLAGRTWGEQLGLGSVGGDGLERLQMVGDTPAPILVYDEKTGRWIPVDQARRTGRVMECASERECRLKK